MVIVRQVGDAESTGNVKIEAMRKSAHEEASFKAIMRLVEADRGDMANKVASQCSDDVIDTEELDQRMKDAADALSTWMRSGDQFVAKNTQDAEICEQRVKNLLEQMVTNVVPEFP